LERRRASQRASTTPSSPRDFLLVRRGARLWLTAKVGRDERPTIPSRTRHDES
jgi:hypothetical protein